MRAVIVGSLIVIVALVAYGVVQARRYDCAGGVRAVGAAPSDYIPRPPRGEMDPAPSERESWNGSWDDRFRSPQWQRTWADLYAACVATDSALGAGPDGSPVCYPLGQKAAP